MSSIHQRVVQFAQQMFQILVLQCFKKASFVEILTSLRSRLGEKYSSSRTRAQFAAKGELTRFSPYYIRLKINRHIIQAYCHVFPLMLLNHAIHSVLTCYSVS